MGTPNSTRRSVIIVGINGEWNDHTRVPVGVSPQRIVVSQGMREYMAMEVLRSLECR